MERRKDIEARKRPEDFTAEYFCEFCGRSMGTMTAAEWRQLRSAHQQCLMAAGNTTQQPSVAPLEGLGSLVHLAKDAGVQIAMSGIRIQIIAQAVKDVLEQTHEHLLELLEQRIAALLDAKPGQITTSTVVPGPSSPAEPAHIDKALDGPAAS